MCWKIPTNFDAAARNFLGFIHFVRVDVECVPFKIFARSTSRHLLATHERNKMQRVDQIRCIQQDFLFTKKQAERCILFMYCFKRNTRYFQFPIYTKKCINKKNYIVIAINLKLYFSMINPQHRNKNYRKTFRNEDLNKNKNKITTKKISL